MKILTVAATPFFSDRGCHIRIYNEAKYLQKMGAEVLVCTYHVGEDVPGVETRRISRSAWYRKTTPGFAWGKLWLDLKLLGLCIREIKKQKYDVVHAHLFESLAIAKLARLLAFKKIPIVLDLQGDLEGEFQSYNQSQKGMRGFFARLSKIVFKWADAVVVSSQNVLKKIREKHNPSKEPTVVGDGVDEDIFQNPEPKIFFTNREELKLIEEWKGEDKLLIYAGGMNDSKGAGDLINEFLSDAENLRGWKLLMFGKGEHRGRYRHIAIQTGQEDRVWFAEESGYFALPHYLELADAAIDPKRDSSESSGKLANYMAAGLPVICFENDFNRAILGEKGLYIKGWESFSKNLKDLQTRDFSEKMSYNLEEFSEKREVDKLWEVFEGLVNNKA